MLHVTFFKILKKWWMLNFVTLVENFYAMQNKPTAKYAPLELYYWKKRSYSNVISPKYANWDRFLVSKLRQYWNASLHKTTI